MAVDSVAVAEFTEQLGELNFLAQEELVALLRHFDDVGLSGDAALREVLRAVPQIVEGYRPAAAEIAGVFYEDTQDLVFSSDAVASAGQVPAGQLQGSARWAVYSNSSDSTMETRLSGVMQRFVLNGARLYAHEVMGRDEGTKRGWVRAAQPDACAFCRMLATRYWYEEMDYASAEKAGLRSEYADKSVQVKGDRYHDHCRCVPVLRAKYTPPDYVHQWEHEYRQIADGIEQEFQSYFRESERPGFVHKRNTIVRPTIRADDVLSRWREKIGH